MELGNYEDYVEFMNGLPFDVFVGNYLVTLYSSDGIECYLQILEESKTIVDYVEEVVDEYITEEYNETSR